MADMFGTASNPTYGLSGNYSFGNRFTVSTTFTASYWRWYRSTLGDGMVSYFILWNITDNVKLLQQSPTDPGGTGWLEAAMDSPQTLVAGKTYQVEQQVLGGNTLYGWPTAPPSINSPFTVTGVRYGGSPSAYSDSISSWELTAVQVADGPMSGGGGGGGGTLDSTDLANIGGELAKWLSSDGTTQLHELDGLPWLTRALLQTTYDVVSAIATRLDTTAGPLSVLTNAYLNEIKTQLDAQEALDALVSSRLTGASGGGGSAFYGPSGTQVAEGVEQLLASGITPTSLGAALALLREQLALSPDLSDTTRWTLVDTTSGEGDALLSQQADAYFLSLTAYPSTQPAHGVAATLWLPRWGWVCPRVHGHFAQRQFHDVMPTIITSEGHFMDGLLIYTPQGFEWTCESYVLDR